MTTPYTDGGNERVCVYDFWVQAVHMENFRVDINSEGTELSVCIRLPDNFINPDRLGREMTLVGPRDSLANAFTETIDSLHTDHGTHDIWTLPEKIALPFKYDNEFTKVLCWNEGEGTRCFPFFASHSSLPFP
jgi:hypothetical protein